MDIELAQVAVILKALNVPLSVASKDDRIAMQKAIYLAQKARDLGYRFSWYLNGPYSTDLADDYYAAAAKHDELEKYSADEETIRALEPVGKIIHTQPQSATLADWLEAVASLDFMKKLRWKSPDTAVSVCKRQKPHLDHLFDQADQVLTENGF